MLGGVTLDHPSDPSLDSAAEGVDLELGEHLELARMPDAPRAPDLTPAQIDRACGALLGSAVGDALGAGYEFDAVRPGPDGPQMIGGGLGNFEPGEWTDDTSMAWCIAEVAASEVMIASEEGLTAIARNFRDWFESRPADIGIQTRAVLAASGPSPTGHQMAVEARHFHGRTGRSGGNGSLMRTAPVALQLLGEHKNHTVYAARAISTLTHVDDDAWQACILWTVAIRHAVLTGEFDIRQGLENLTPYHRKRWVQWIAEAEQRPPAIFRPNGWVVTAFQAAWSAIMHTPVPEDEPCRHLQDALATAINIGDDTDTVAAIAGALLGAVWGASAVPARWRRILHGYPGISGERLVELATLAANRGPIVHGWPLADRIDYTRFGASGVIVQHPADSGVHLGDAATLDHLPDEIDAVVSLCLVGKFQIPADVESVLFRLIDEPSRENNPNLDFVIADAAATIKALREEGKVVFLHCAAGQSRTPTVAAAYSMMLGHDRDEALDAICAALPGARPNRTLHQALDRMQNTRSARSSRSRTVRPASVRPFAHTGEGDDGASGF